ncbi:MAG: hypothetical protein O7F76_06395, partial [Planctomycetota bacterium]|nr:hypothetical protein [Planctomycetota bacterium]
TDDTHRDARRKEADSPANASPSREHDPQSSKPPTAIDQMKAVWARHNARNLKRAKPGSLHEAIARIYAAPHDIKDDT